MELVLIGIIILIVGVVLCLIPSRVLDKIINVFSFSGKGIRYIRRRHDKVDSLGNYMLFGSILFSILYFFIPYYHIVYGVLLTLVFLCVLACANKIGKKLSKKARFIIIFGLYLVYAISLICSTGIINGMAFEKLISVFYKDLMSNKLFNIFYLLTNHSVPAYLLQGLLFVFPMYVLLAQFKYMRLEKSYKSNNLVTFIIKVIVVCIVLVVFSYKGFDFINIVYQVA